MEISVISGSGPEIENPYYRFLMLPMELSVLLSRLEAPQESLTLPNEIFSHVGQQFGQATATDNLGGDESSISLLKTASKI